LRRERLLQVDVLSLKGVGVYGDKLDLIVKQVVEIVGDKDEAGKEVLLKTGFQRPIALRLQIEIGKLEGAADEGLFEARFLDAGGIRKVQSSAGEHMPAV